MSKKYIRCEEAPNTEKENDSHCGIEQADGNALQILYFFPSDLSSGQISPPLARRQLSQEPHPAAQFQ